MLGSNMCACYACIFRIHYRSCFFFSLACLGDLSISYHRDFNFLTISTAVKGLRFYSICKLKASLPQLRGCWQLT